MPTTLKPETSNFLLNYGQAMVFFTGKMHVYAKAFKVVPSKRPPHAVALVVRTAAGATAGAAQGWLCGPVRRRSRSAVPANRALRGRAVPVVQQRHHLSVYDAVHNARWQWFPVYRARHAVHAGHPGL